MGCIITANGCKYEKYILRIKAKQIKIYFLYLLLCVCIQKLIPYKKYDYEKIR